MMQFVKISLRWEISYARILLDWYRINNQTEREVVKF
jgi:hypothetical protein